MRLPVSLLFLILSQIFGAAQENNLVRILDASTGAPLEYVLVNTKPAEESYLSNEDGYFRINAGSSEEMLWISHPGYENKSFPVYEALAEKIIKLTPKTRRSEVTTKGLKEKDLVKKMKKSLNKLNSNQIRISKSFLELSTFEKDTPVEYLRFYYSNAFKGLKIYDDMFKAGQLASSIHSENIFYTFNPIELFHWLDFFSENTPLPKTPFLMNNGDILNNYKITGGTDSQDPDLVFVKCVPVANKRNLSAFEIRMDRQNNPVSFKISADHALLFPVFPALGEDSISDYTYDLEYVFDNMSKSPLLRLIKFSYAIKYNHKTDTGSGAVKDIYTHGILHFYNYKQSFIIPDIFYGPQEISHDYKRAALMIYDSAFWNKENTLLISEAKRDLIAYFGSNGALVNYGDEYAHFDNYKKYTSLLKKELSEPLLEWNYETYFFPPVNTDLEKTCKICIPGVYYLDFNLYDSSFSLKSKTFLLSNRIKYYNDGSPEKIAYFRIHMDLLEYYRLNIIEDLKDISSIEKAEKYLYKEFKKLKKELKKLSKDTRSGENPKALKKWNNLMANRTGRDHLALLRSK